MPPDLPDGVTDEEASENYARLVKEGLIDEERTPIESPDGVVLFKGTLLHTTRTYLGSVELARLDRMYQVQRSKKFTLW